MRVLQLIDTLTPGGAERVALNLANSLEGEVEASYLCCTRDEGMLKEELDDEVGFCFLNKKHSFDLRAFWKLTTFIKKEQIDLVHAHGTSWFWGVLLKLSGLNIKLVWHDHYGESEELEKRDVKFLKPLSRYFDGIISVNDDLKAWAKRELSSDKVIQLNNFIVPSKEVDSGLKLKGDPTDFKIVCVANLRPQKDHLNLLLAFEILSIEEISLHLIGVDPGSNYSQALKKEITKSGKKIFHYGSTPNVFGLLEQADLGVLSSRSEGLPLALLEYALAGLPVVCTEVGQCREVVDDAALLVPPSNPKALGKAIRFYFHNVDKRKKDAYRLHKRLKKTYSKEALLPVLSNFYNNL
ncbi:glycosyltransferase [Salegentibacter sp. LM13S]|uniref:glycosyltransferase n=1 Tax=Salegentibacter lacus TaxID=2873599 RepID=UPI001CCE953B|nr:glycosyltransferase [Salegentibacter lacus]MBZ9632001.1 glycosyltransferase [Salegentibacter lacus]